MRLKYKINVSHLKYWIAIVFWALLVAVIIKSFLLVPIQVNGISMEPTLHSKEEMLITLPGKIKRFDIVIIKTPDHVTYVKRVIGLPGDTLKYKNDHLYINRQRISEPFISREIADKNENYTSDFTLKELTGLNKIPRNQYFVLGDNRRISKDSRTIGTIEGSWIVGKAILIYWPLNCWRWLYKF
ncbi:MAG: signal peptidase I [Liquorilactobacillus nagelii]|jgi:signal peptidase I|uniref:signal peptidase I n=1 Tax=Liquorilactobacillus nagelii TaxID=82688 RepID=UPI00070A3A82|nr:signal peptidase I [Liquorilactobacillus nagelii]MCC7615343.1 signal peptidase I [Liquorilactobacillus nagelii]MCI1700233.1 signal peptidase I [Liquorilactobacillus nagelii]MCP9315953.1 signal peptidase I [Liquorilactobacillus nagelii]QYH53878.1 signal peptidase I [Liquorilactobacillus nagelii DSM 13675]